MLLFQNGPRIGLCYGQFAQALAFHQGFDAYSAGWMMKEVTYGTTRNRHYRK
jgi:hypothetical protein